MFRRSSGNLSYLIQSVGGLPCLSHHSNAAVVAGALLDPVASSLGPAPDAVPASVSVFDERIIKTKPKYFLNLTCELGYEPLVEQVGRRVLRRTPFEETQAKVVPNVFIVNRSIVLCAAACKKPNDAEMGQLLKPMMTDWYGISSIKDKSE